MGRYGFCWNANEHERQAERDHDRGHRDYEMYDRYSMDACKEAYTERWDREERRERDELWERYEQERQEEARSEREAAERRWQEEFEYSQQVAYDEYCRSQEPQA